MVRRERSRARAGDEKVSSEVELERCERRILRAVADALEPDARRNGLVPFAKIERHAVVVAPVVTDMPRQRRIDRSGAVLRGRERRCACRRAKDDDSQIRSRLEDVRARGVLQPNLLENPLLHFL